MKIFALLISMLVSATPAKSEENRPVAVIAGNDRITCVHLYNFLCAHGIASRYSGGVLYEFVVPARRVEEARDLIRGDARKRKYDVVFDFKHGIGVNGAQKPQERFDRRIAFVEVLRRKAYSSGTSPGKLLRRQEVVDLATNYPYTDSMEVVVRRYLAAPRRLRTAYQVDLHLIDRLGPNGNGNGFATFYVGEDGRDIGF